MSSPRHLADRLPDVPRWVEARHYLHSGACEVFGLEETPELALVVRDPDTGFLMVIGAPAVSAIRAAASNLVPGGDLVAAPEHADWVAEALPDWTRTRGILHVLRHPERLPPAESADVRFVDIATLSAQPLISMELLCELGLAASAIAATFIDERPVSFCYAGATTESLWDIAIDTLENHRRQGHAASCIAHMICHMQNNGRSPVWTALEENAASWRLAQKLGFEAVDEVVFFQPPSMR